MAQLTNDEKAAWQALRGTQHELGLCRRGAKLHTGYSVAAAQTELTRRGMPPEAAQAVLRSVALKRFPAFAGSWSSYLSENGWGIELSQLDAAQQADFEQRYNIKGAGKLFEQLRRDPMQALGAAPELIGYAMQVGQLENLDDVARHPAFEFLTTRHGLHPELAKAVALYGREVPLWAIGVGSLVGLVFTALAVVACIDPQNAMFTSDGAHGAGLAQKLLLPLGGLGSLSLMFYLLRDRPRRRKAWVEQLQRYAQAGG